MSRVSRGIVVVGALVGLALGWSSAQAADPPPPAECSPTKTFSTTIDNQYAPMEPGQKSTFFGIDEKVRLGLKIKVLDATESFFEGSVTTRVVREIEWADKDGDGVIDHNEKLIEVSDNFFAQTSEGTVCYFGEDVRIYEKNGKFRGNTSGSWRADASGNAPGVFMPANPQVNVTYQMEFAPGIAMDQATPLGFEDDVAVPEGTFDSAMRVRDCNPLESSDSCGIKYYAPGVGLIIDGPVELTEFVDATP